MNGSASSPLYILPLFCFKKANLVSASPGTVSVNLSDDQGRHSQRADQYLQCRRIPELMMSKRYINLTCIFVFCTITACA